MNAPTRKPSDLTLLARAIAENLRTEEYIFRPKRGETNKAQGWQDRFLKYRWGTAHGPFDHWDLLSKLETELSSALSDRLNGQAWTKDRQAKLIESTFNLFTWGHVTRGTGHNPPSIEDIALVMMTASSYSDNLRAPLDSAWTKLAALSTGGLVGHELPPQVIFDSRVSVSLLEQIEAAVSKDECLSQTRDRLRSSGLGYVPGRGGYRIQRTANLRCLGWNSAYRKWSAQFSASYLVNEIVGVLNQDGRFGLMPTQGGATQPWTTRGVEMVLFMDGY